MEYYTYEKQRRNQEKIESMSKEELVDFYMEKDFELNKKDLEINHKNSEIAWYKEQLALMNKIRFSTKSEKAICDQLNLFDEIEDTYDMQAEEAVEVKVKKKKKSREAIFQNYLLK